MSTTEATPSSETRLACPCCGAANAEVERYCASCGLTLWESCSSCKKSARIGQKFCGGCGYNLSADVEGRLRAASTALERAREAFERSEFDEAIAAATRVIRREDPRFSRLSDEATQLIDKARQASEQWRAKIENIREAADRAANAEDFESVIDLLSPFPPPVLGEALARSLALARSQAAAVGELSLRLRRAIEANDLMVAGRLVEELLAHRPKHQEYSKLAGKIGSALLQSAERRFQKGLYADAFARLEAMPEAARGVEKYLSLRSRIDEAIWLMDQLSGAPFATPLLARFAQRLCKLDPQNAYAPKLLNRLVVKVRSTPADSRSMYSAWVDEPRGWMDAPVLLLNRPQQFTGSAAMILKRHPTRFAIAIGLALQGIGFASCKGCLSTVPKKPGLKSLLSRTSRVESAWGIDAGASAIRAVRLEQMAAGVRIAEAYLIPYEQPPAQAHGSARSSAGFERALREIAAKIAASRSGPVWSNMPSRETLGRFVTLPPVPEKTLVKIVDQEALSGFPLAADELCVTHTIANPSPDGSRRAVWVAARRDGVEQREKTFAEAGIKLSGVQADPLALHNFARHELISCFDSSKATDAVPEGIVLLDGGASGTTFYMATRETFWFRFVDGGGEDLTTRLAASCAVPRNQAESLKIDPATIPSLPSAMRPLENQMQQMAIRLNQCYRSAAEFSGEVQLKYIFCTGGAPLVHGWVRHILQDSLHS